MIYNERKVHCCFAGHSYKTYNVNGKFFEKVSFIDLAINIEQ